MAEKRESASRSGMEAKGSHSSKPRSKIPVPRDGEQSAGNEVVLKHDGDVSEQKLAKTSIAFSSAAASREQETEPLGKDQANVCCAIPSARNAEPPAEGKSEALKRQATSKTKPVIKRSVYPIGSNAHSGTSFLPSPKKCPVPKPFHLGEKHKGPPRRKEISSQLNAFSEQRAAGTASRPLGQKVQEAKSKGMEKPGKGICQKLDDVTNPVFNEAPKMLKKFSGHSGITFKLRQPSRTTLNPFTADNSSNESASPCSQPSGNTKSDGNCVPKS